MAEYMNRKILRLSIIDPVGKKAGLDHYDLSLARRLKNKGCQIKVYSNFDNNEYPLIKNHFEFTFANGPVRLIKLLIEYFSALRFAKADKTEIIILHIFH